MRGGRFLLALTLLLAAVACPATAQDRTPTGAIAPAKKAGLHAFGPWTDDLDAMRKRRVVRILVPYSKTIYFIDKGEELGTAVEWGRALGQWLNAGKEKEIEKVRVVYIPVPRDRLLSALNEGHGDIAAGNLTITDERLKLVDFTTPGSSRVREVLVTGPSAPPIATLEDMFGRELYVRKTSSYHAHLAAMNATRSAEGRSQITLMAADEHFEDEDILEMVNAGLLPYAVVDDHVARIWSKVFKSLKVRDDIAIHEGGQIAAAVRKTNPKLKAALDEFIRQQTVGSSFGAYVRKRYYTDDKMVRRAYAPADMQRFRELTRFFRQYGSQYDFDHVLIAAQGYQESKLNQAERSKAGAVGVMQLLPRTARIKEVAIPNIDKSAERNIEAGNKYLRHLITVYINDPEIDPVNRTLLAFAAYNAGPGNLKKFRAKATEMGLDPNVWFDNVENAAAAIIGRETVQYVSNIYKYYVAYKLAVRAQDEKKQAPQVKAR